MYAIPIRSTRPPRSCASILLALFALASGCVHSGPDVSTAGPGEHTEAPAPPVPLPSDPIDSAPPEALTDAPIQMRDSVYVLPVDPRYLSAAVMIWATYTNRMGDTVFLKTCVRRNPSFRLEKWVMGRWVHAYSPPACYGAYDGPPPTVRPGGIHTDSLPIIYAFTPTLREGAGWKVEEFSGIYRLVYQIYRTWTPPDASWPNRGVSGLLPKEQRVSNAFRMIDPTRPGGQRSGSMGRRVTAAAN